MYFSMAGGIENLCCKKYRRPFICLISERRGDLRGPTPHGGHRFSSNGVIFVIEDHPKKRAIHLDAAVVFDVSGVAETVHQYIDARPGTADEGGESLLADLRDAISGIPIFTEVCHVEEGAGEAFFGGVEELVDEVCLDAAGALQQVGDEEVRHAVLFGEYANHFVASDAEESAVGEGGGRGDEELYARGETLFADEVSGSEDSEGGLLSDAGDDDKPGFPALEVKDAVPNVTLREDALPFAEVHDCSSQAGVGEEGGGIERDGSVGHERPFAGRAHDRREPKGRLDLRNGTFLHCWCKDQCRAKRRGSRAEE